MPELDRRAIARPTPYVERTVMLDPEVRSGAVSRAIESASNAGRAAGSIFTAGYLEANARAVAVATSHGLFAYHRSTDADLSVTARTPDGTGSGWATGGARDFGQVDPASIGRIAAEKAVASRNPQSIEPGLYTAVLDPRGHRSRPAAIECAQRTHRRRGAQSVLETGWRHAYRREGDGRPGDALLGSRRPAVARTAVRQRRTAAAACRLGGERCPAQSRVSRFWAQKQRRQPTGPALAGGGWRRLTGGTKSTEELIAGCTRGILVTHFFYIRSLDPRTVLQTGLTRDGTFLIDNGRITRALKNFRWNESPLLMLNRLEDIGRPVLTTAGRLMPALRVREFNFSSLSDAV